MEHATDAVLHQRPEALDGVGQDGPRARFEATRDAVLADVYLEASEALPAVGTMWHSGRVSVRRGDGIIINPIERGRLVAVTGPEFEARLAMEDA